MFYLLHDSECDDLNALEFLGKKTAFNEMTNQTEFNDLEFTPFLGKTSYNGMILELTNQNVLTFKALP